MWRGEHVGGRTGFLIGMLLLAAACSSTPASDENSTTTGSDTTTESGATSTEAGSETSNTTVAPGPDCTIPEGQPFNQSEPVELTELGEVNGARISAALYPHPGYQGDPWSQWGQGIAIEDGRYYSAIGDHHQIEGNSFIYEYDPTSDTLTMVGDILSYVDQVPGTAGHGKVHSQMVPGPCGEIYFSTYWGSSREVEFEGNYTGELLFRLDPFGETLQPLEVPVEFHGQASMGAAPVFGIVYGEAVDPLLRDEQEQGPFFAYDVVDEEVVFTGPDQPHVGYRSILVDTNGVGYWSIGGRQLQAYDPATGESTTHDATLPGDWLRAVTEPAPDGSVYGVTRDPDTFFVMNPDGSIDSLGDALGYTASMALSPDGSTFYYMPGAHGNSIDWGSPLVAVDTSTGEETVVAELYDIVAEGLGYRVGGTYNVAVSPDGNTVFMGVNVGESGTEESFGEVALLVIELP